MKRIEQIMQHPLYQYHQTRIEEFEKDRIFCKHGFAHALDVARILYIQVLEQNLPIKKDVVYGTAILHDIGRAKQYGEKQPHHEAGAAIAGEILAECGYEKEEIAQITDAIKEHRENDSEESLARLLYRADKLSRDCYQCNAKKECYWEEHKKNQTVTY